MGTYDLTLVILTLALPLLWWFRESLPFIGSKPRLPTSNGTAKTAVDEGDPRDFVQRMERAVSYNSR